MRFAEYGPILTQAYDIDKPEAPSDELDLYLGVIADGGEPVLAAMCGSGRFLVALRERGIDVDGVDASSAMVAACRAKLEAKECAAQITESTLQAMTLGRRYATAFIGGGGSFGLIADRDDAREAIRRLLDHLLPGGLLAFAVLTPAMVPRHFGRPHVRSWKRSDGARIVLTSTELSYQDGVLETIGAYELYVDGKVVDTELDDFPQRLYERAEIAGQLEEAGASEVVISPVGEHLLWCTARRTATDS
jgi:SAM-dependent methyltransferase